MLHPESSITGGAASAQVVDLMQPRLLAPHLQLGKQRDVVAVPRGELSSQSAPSLRKDAAAGSSGRHWQLLPPLAAPAAPGSSCCPWQPAVVPAAAAVASSPFGAATRRLLAVPIQHVLTLRYGLPCNCIPHSKQQRMRQPCHPFANGPTIAVAASFHAGRLRPADHTRRPSKRNQAA